MSEVKWIQFNMRYGEPPEGESKICRVCLESSRRVANIHDKTLVHELTNWEVIEICFPVQPIRNEACPQHICSLCLMCLRTCVKFYKALVASQIKLSATFKSTNLEPPQQSDYDFEPLKLTPSHVKVERKEVVQNWKSKEPINFIEWSDIQYHLRFVGSYNAISCPICSKKFASKISMVGHLHLIHKMPYKCHSCDTFLPTWNDKVKHRLIHHTKLHRCSQCPQVYITNKALQGHKLRVHSGDESTKSKSSSAIQNQSLCCKICNKIFKSKDTTRGHMRRMHNLKLACNKCDMTFSTCTEQKVHRKVHYTKCIACSLCKKIFGNKYRLVKHIEACHQNGGKDNVYGHGEEDGELDENGERHIVKMRDISKCLVCDTVVESSAHLKIHLKQHMDSEQRICCLKCPMRLKSYKNYRMHLNERHGSRQFICSVCGLELKTTGSLRHHLKRHNKEYVYKCDHCPKRFLFPYHLTMHKSVNHSDRREIVCKQCDKRFATRTQLVRHERLVHTHENHECDVCGKTFKNKFLFKTHYERHGPKKLACMFCESCFSTKTNLQRHIRTHTLEKSMNCNLCNGTFDQASFIYHLRADHDGEYGMNAVHPSLKKIEHQRLKNLQKFEKSQK